MGNAPENCGVDDMNILVSLDTPGQIKIHNISTDSACSWVIYDRILGFLKFGGELLEVQIEEAHNMNVVIGSGKSIDKLLPENTQEDVVIGEWYEYPVT